MSICFTTELARVLKASETGASGSEITMGVPWSPPIRTFVSNGISPRNGTLNSLLAFFPRMDAAEQSAAVGTLCSTTSSTLALLNAVERKEIPVEAIKPTQ